MVDLQSPPTPTDDAGACLRRYLTNDDLTLLLVRHGQAGGPPIDGLDGDGLTAMGCRQASRVAARLSQMPLDQVYCSDMARSYQTADQLRQMRPDIPFLMTGDLREVHPFHMPGRPPARTREQRAILKRERDAAGRFVSRLCEHRAGQVVAIIGHERINRLVVSSLAGVPSRRTLTFAAYHTAVSVISRDASGQPTVRLTNCTRHLSPEMITYINDVHGKRPAERVKTGRY